MQRASLSTINVFRKAIKIGFVKDIFTKIEMKILMRLHGQIQGTTNSKVAGHDFHVPLFIMPIQLIGSTKLYHLNDLSRKRLLHIQPIHPINNLLAGIFNYISGD